MTNQEIEQKITELSRTHMSILTDLQNRFDSQERLDKLVKQAQKEIEDGKID